MSDHDPQYNNRPPCSRAEWVTFSLAALVLSSITGLIVYSWATKRDRPVTLTLMRPDGIRRVDSQFYIPFEIKNTGGEPAESIQVIAELEQNGSVEERGDLQIDLLASQEIEKGAFVFTKDPQAGELTLRIGSYKVP